MPVRAPVVISPPRGHRAGLRTHTQTAVRSPIRPATRIRATPTSRAALQAARSRACTSHPTVRMPSSASVLARIRQSLQRAVSSRPPTSSRCTSVGPWQLLWAWTESHRRPTTCTSRTPSVVPRPRSTPRRSRRHRTAPAPPRTDPAPTGSTSRFRSRRSRPSRRRPSRARRSSPLSSGPPRRRTSASSTRTTCRPER